MKVCTGKWLLKQNKNNQPTRACDIHKHCFKAMLAIICLILFLPLVGLFLAKKLHFSSLDYYIYNITKYFSPTVMTKLTQRQNSNTNILRKKKNSSRPLPMCHDPTIPRFHDSTRPPFKVKQKNFWPTKQKKSFKPLWLTSLANTPAKSMNLYIKV